MSPALLTLLGALASVPTHPNILRQDPSGFRKPGPRTSRHRPRWGRPGPRRPGAPASNVSTAWTKTRRLARAVPRAAPWRPVDAGPGRAASARPAEGWPATHRAHRVSPASGQHAEPKEADHSSKHDQADAGGEERNHEVHLLELPADLCREGAVDALQLARGLRIEVLTAGWRRDGRERGFIDTPDRLAADSRIAVTQPDADRLNLHSRGDKLGRNTLWIDSLVGDSVRKNHDHGRA